MSTLEDRYRRDRLRLRERAVEFVQKLFIYCVERMRSIERDQKPAPLLFVENRFVVSHYLRYPASPLISLSPSLQVSYSFSLQCP